MDILLQNELELDELELEFEKLGYNKARDDDNFLIYRSEHIHQILGYSKDIIFNKQNHSITLCHFDTFTNKLCEFKLETDLIKLIQQQAMILN